MRTTRFGLALLIVGCAEPTATLSRPVAATIIVEQKTNSYSVDASGRTVYIRLVQVRGEGRQPIHEFVVRAMASADSTGAQRLVVDLRSVVGSDARLLVPLIKGILTRDRFARVGGLYVVIGPDSFSQAQNAATLLRRYANPIFVDHPPASGSMG